MDAHLRKMEDRMKELDTLRENLDDNQQWLSHNLDVLGWTADHINHQVVTYTHNNCSSYNQVLGANLAGMYLGS